MWTRHRPLLMKSLQCVPRDIGHQYCEKWLQALCCNPVFLRKCARRTANVDLVSNNFDPVETSCDLPVFAPKLTPRRVQSSHLLNFSLYNSVIWKIKQFLLLIDLERSLHFNKYTPTITHLIHRASHHHKLRLLNVLKGLVSQKLAMPKEENMAYGYFN